MCVNDVVVQGAEPLFFLDYIAVGKLRPELIASLLEGMADGCRQAGCAILGGEMAEMPGFYANGHYELAGFAVGVVEKDRLVLGQRVRPGDQVIGLLSSGIHSNGYSLVRRVFFGRGAKRQDVDRVLPGCDLPLGEELLRPTRIYVKPILSVLRQYLSKKVIHAMAHITGGGLPGNVPRVLPTGVDAVLDLSTWERPAIFGHLQRLGKVSDEEMFRVFNMGIGMVVVVAAFYCDSVLAQFRRLGFPAVRIGEIAPGSGQVRFRG
jgi:phosphoribosylformylglycinamidine cyclo-ligase